MTVSMASTLVASSKMLSSAATRTRNLLEADGGRGKNDTIHHGSIALEHPAITVGHDDVTVGNGALKYNQLAISETENMIRNYRTDNTSYTTTVESSTTANLDKQTMSDISNEHVINAIGNTVKASTRTRTLTISSASALTTYLTNTTKVIAGTDRPSSGLLFLNGYGSVLITKSSNSSTKGIFINPQPTATGLPYCQRYKSRFDIQTRPRVVFVFSLYGEKPRYTVGMVDNARMLLAAFPDAIVKIYVASDVPAYVKDVLVRYPNVRIVHVPRMRGIHNMYDRFRAYDDDDYDILFVRDADSRVHLRDQDCIRQFCASDRMFHIIRDHKSHEQLIMGGMWGARKGAIRGLSEPLATVAETFQRAKANSSRYGSDQNFFGTGDLPLS
jgi:hypothetical protein